MRLLKINDSGEFSLTTFPDSNVPKYAILSHTWGPDSTEVTYQDILDDKAKAKAGYRKLQFCSDQAITEGLQYFWSDTCCIDKSNHSELSKSINSMYRWYQDAEVCYVYLSDVSVYTQNREFKHLSWDSTFYRSRWFTRGWTLQELLAPKSVEFYSCDGVRLGDKKSLETKIYEITGIALDAIRGRPLSRFSVDQRLLWRASRQTTEEEDKAYCLLGIFGVHMPLIYGEGEKSAMKRLLKEIRESSDGVVAGTTFLMPHGIYRSNINPIRQYIFASHGTCQ
jgi:hypothetical protein